MAPLPGRALSSVAVRCDPTGELLLFDCGEGTQVQLRKAGLRPNAVSHIFISHTHADHVTGLPGLLMLMAQGERTEPLRIWGPPRTAEYVRSLSVLEPRLPFEVRVENVEGAGVIFEAESYTVSCAELVHSRTCYGYRVQGRRRPGHFDAEAAARLGVPDGPERGRLLRGEAVRVPDGRLVRPEDVVGPERPGPSLVYATDTRPCDSLVELARACDLLICEGLYGPGLDEGAAEKMHMTAAEAAELARRAGARSLRTIHVSQRYRDEDLPALDELIRGIFPAGAVARDLERIRVSPPADGSPAPGR